MISENDLNIIKEASTNEEENTMKEESSSTVDTNKEEETTVASSEQPDTSKEEEQLYIDELEKSYVLPKPDMEREMDTQPLLEQPAVLEGKRSRKPTLRLELSVVLSVKKELSIPQGHGKPLGEIEYINYQITHASTDVLSRMRNICFGRRGNKATIRKHLRQFKGFEFVQNSDEYEKHLSNLIKLKKDQLRSISNILGLQSTGRNTDQAERILTFLVKPTDEGKRLPGKKSAIRNSKKRSTNSKESMDTDQEIVVKLDNDSKPSKRKSNHDAEPDAKRKKVPSTKSKSMIVKETVEVNGNDITNGNLTDQNDAIMNNIVQDVV